MAERTLRGDQVVVSRQIFVEGGGEANDLNNDCRRAFGRLLKGLVPAAQLPRIRACGSRNEAFEAFRHAQVKGDSVFLGMLIDSEDPVEDSDRPWDHLLKRDNWQRPAGATDEQVFLMTTSMETWLIADRAALRGRFRGCLQETALPSPPELEQRTRQEVLRSLEKATEGCGRGRGYAKGKKSFEVLERLDPGTLSELLPAFVRMKRILDSQL